MELRTIRSLQIYRLQNLKLHTRKFPDFTSSEPVPVALISYYEYLLKSSAFWEITPRNPLEANRCVWWTRRLHLCLLPASCVVSCLAHSSTLKMEATCSSETLIDFQRTARRPTPEDRTLHGYSCENLKSSSFFAVWSATNNYLLQTNVTYFMELEIQAFTVKVTPFRQSLKNTLHMYSYSYSRRPLVWIWF
jgi:hypothetical protein